MKKIETIAAPAAIVEAAPLAIWNAPAVQNVTMETLSIGDYLDWDELALPVWQRASVWSPKQQEALAETIMAGRAIPAIIVGDIPADPEKGLAALSLLVDGRQRTEAIKALVNGLEALEDMDDTDSAKLDYILGYPLRIMRVDCGTTAEAAELYRLYNSGSALTAIQRNKAALPHDVLAMVQPYVDGMTAIFGNRFGRQTTDSVAMMLAAGLANPATATTSAASASKVLMAAAGKDIPAYPAALVAAYAAAIESENCPNPEFLKAAARLVPAVLAAVETDIPPAEFTDIVGGPGLSSDTAWFNSSHTTKSKTPKTTIAVTSLSIVFGDTANSVKSTSYRRQAFAALFTGQVAYGAKPATPAALKKRVGQVEAPADAVVGMIDALR